MSPLSPTAGGGVGALRHCRNVPLEETSSGLGSMEPGNDTSKVQCPRKLFPELYIGIETGNRPWSFLGTRVCLPCVQRPNTRNSRATFGCRHRCWGGKAGGDGTFFCVKEMRAPFDGQWKEPRKSSLPGQVCL